MNLNEPSRLAALGKYAALLAAMLAIALANRANAAAFPALNTPPTQQHVPGKFIWADLFSGDAAAASRFYSGLLGWTATPVEQNDKSYFVMMNGGQPVAGIVQRGDTSAKRPSVWVPYASVADAKAALASVESAGGKVRAKARRFPDRGTQALITDNEGAVVGILSSSSGDPADVEPRPGDWNWFELFSLSPTMAAGFYEQVLGYSVSADTRSNKIGHLLLSAGGQTRAGVAPLPAGRDSSPGWLGCIRVDDVDAAAAKALALGGTVLESPRPAALGSRFAIVSDPTGGAVGLIQYVDSENPSNHP
jgi:predicted enzyme related to lactoylglutathione lyase